MERTSLEAARAELERSTSIFAEMKTAQSMKALEESWKAFLGAAHRVFTKLEHGAKGGPAKGWYDGIKHTRKTDELLSYVMHARNAHEHGVKQVTDRTREGSFMIPGGFDIVDGKMRPREVHIEQMEINKGDVRIKFGGGGPEIRFSLGSVILVPVTDRGTTYRVPSTHLGASIDGRHPVLVADYALRYLTSIVEEASRFQHPVRG